MSTVEGPSTPIPKAVIPKHVVAQLGEFNKALGEAEQALEKHFAIDFDQHIKNVSLTYQSLAIGHSENCRRYDSD